MEIIRNAILPGTMPHFVSAKPDWPFKDMNIGDMVKFDLDDSRFRNPQRYAHIYGANSGKKFATQKIGRELHVYRVG